jgi:hypothetical protein
MIAYSFMTGESNLNSEDYLRFGILEFEKGMIEKSWQHISLALLSDPDIENRKHAYKSYIARIIQRKFGSNINVPQFLKSHRLGNKTQTNKH